MTRLGCAALATSALSLTACASGPTFFNNPFQRPAAVVMTATNCQDVSLPIYFDVGSTELTAPAAQALKESAALTRGCSVREVLVLGLADADGSSDRNMELSRKRAERVAAALTAEGLPAPAFDLEAAGDAGAVSPSGAPEPLRRRAEVVIRLAEKS